MAADTDDEPDLRVVATAGSEPEAELMQQRLTAAGITSLAQRTIGSAEWGTSGARYVYVRAGDLDRARGILGIPPPSSNPA